MINTQRLEPVITDLVVTLAEIKQHLIVGHDDDDVLITRLVLAALSYAENHCERSYRVRKHKVTAPCWPSCGMPLRYGPVRRIDAVEYIDTDGVKQLIGASLWHIVPSTYGQTLEFYTAPTAATFRRSDAVSVSYLAGYGELPAPPVFSVGLPGTLPMTTSGSSEDDPGFPYTLPFILGEYDGYLTDVNIRLPDNVKHAIYMLVGHWYENRESVVVGTTSSPVAIAAQALLDQERVHGV